MSSRKILRTILIVIIAGIAVSGFADTTSQDYAQKSLNRALVTYAAARTLNGVVSVAQGTEVALEPGGVGVVLAPGQVLDPINDLIERFSSVMLVAASSLGLQILLVTISSAWGVTALFVVAMALSLVFIWSPKLADSKYAPITLNVALLFVFVRFAVPLVIICTNFMFSTFLLTEHDTAAAALEGASAKIDQINIQYEEQDTNTKASIVEKLTSNVADWFDSMNVGDRIAQLKTSAAEATSHIINLIVIFVLQTIIFPVAFLWIFVEILKAVASRTISAIGPQDDT